MTPPRHREPPRPSWSSRTSRSSTATRRRVGPVGLDIVGQHVTALIGPSGCGKSTFIRSLNRMNEVVPGCRVDGDVRARRRPDLRRGRRSGRVRRRVGMVFQKPNPFPKIDPRERRLRTAHRRHERPREIGAAWRRALRQSALWDEVKDRLDDSAMGLSGGQQQRLCIARALARRARGAADGRARVGARSDRDRPHRGADPRASAEYTIVIVTHNMQQAARVADYTAFFYLGRAGGVRSHGRAVHQAEQREDRGLHHRAVRMMSSNGLRASTPTANTSSELRRLREQLLLMGAKVEEMIADSIRALVERDTELAEQTIDADRKINQLEIDIDELCLQVLARRQPVASDLRFITTALKLVTDLERIGDLGVNICERVLELNGEPPLKPYVDLPNMAREVAGDAARGARCVRRGRRRARPARDRARPERRRLLRADLPRAADVHDGGSAQHLPRDAPAVDRPSTSSASAITPPTSPRWSCSWSRARTSATPAS